MARVVPDAYRSPWGDAEPCPCESPRSFAQCCKRAGHRLPRIELPGLAPPEPATGYANPRCYTASSANCSRGKSREHYISEAILQRFDRLMVSGMPWQREGEATILPAKAMAANILCARHNSALLGELLFIIAVIILTAVTNLYEHLRYSK